MSLSLTTSLDYSLSISIVDEAEDLQRTVSNYFSTYYETLRLRNIALILLHLKLKLCMRAHNFSINFKILKVKKPLMLFFQSSQEFN